MPFLNNPSGYPFDEEPYKDWHLWVPTPTQDGVTVCDYGLLYPVARMEIYLRCNTGWNADFVQLFGMPIRELKTSKTDEKERQRGVDALQNLASAAYIMTDSMEDELIIHSNAAGGNGYKSYNDFDHRCVGSISKILLGHEDAISSVPGKLGAQQLTTSGSKTDDASAGTPVAKAMRDIQTEDGNFIEPIVSYDLKEKMYNLGIPIPQNLRFRFLNDAEERAISEMEAAKNQMIATLALTFRQGGLQMDAGQTEKLTGLKLKEVPIDGGASTTETNSAADSAKKGTVTKDASKKRIGKPKHSGK
jgi:hypothetical protein